MEVVSGYFAFAKANKSQALLFEKREALITSILLLRREGLSIDTIFKKGKGLVGCVSHFISLGYTFLHSKLIFNSDSVVYASITSKVAIYGNITIPGHVKKVT